MNIILDYGHGSDTAGKRSPDESFFEWQFNRSLGGIITKSLDSLHIHYDVLVPEDSDISLKERVRRVNDIARDYIFGDCILVSIHADAAGNGSRWMNARGWSVHTSDNPSQNSITLANHFYNAAKAILPKEINIRRPSPTQNYWASRFYILKNVNVPAVLTENLFYDNRDDLKLLKDTNMVDMLAAIHTKSIIEYFK